MRGAWDKIDRELVNERKGEIIKSKRDTGDFPVF